MRPNGHVRSQAMHVMGTGGCPILGCVCCISHHSHLPGGGIWVRLGRLFVGGPRLAARPRADGFRAEQHSLPREHTVARVLCADVQVSP